MCLLFWARAHGSHRKRRKVTVPEEIKSAGFRARTVLARRPRQGVRHWLVATGLRSRALIDSSSTTTKVRTTVQLRDSGADPVGCSGGTNAVHGRVVVTFFFLRISLPRVPRSADVTAGYNRVDRMTAGRAETNGHD